MRILMTGATGFIGLKLVQRLIDDGHEVAALVRESTNTSVLPEGIECVTANLLDSESLGSCVNEAEAVIHLAAYFDFYPSDKDLLYAVNIEGTTNLMKACVGTNVTRFIYCSTTETIGSVKYPPGDENTELNPAFDYSKSKVIAEDRIREISAESGLPHVILRPTGVMGEGDLYSAFELIKALNNDEVIAFPRVGDKHIMYAHIDDIVDGFSKAVDSDLALNDTIILCPDEPMSYNELLDFLIHRLGVKGPKFRVPTILAKVGVGLMSLYKNRKRNTFLWHMQTIQVLVEERWYSNKKAKEILKWIPKITMREGLGRAIEWAYTQGYLKRRS